MNITIKPPITVTLDLGDKIVVATFDGTKMADVAVSMTIEGNRVTTRYQAPAASVRVAIDMAIENEPSYCAAYILLAGQSQPATKEFRWIKH